MAKKKAMDEIKNKRAKKKLGEGNLSPLSSGESGEILDDEYMNDDDSDFSGPESPGRKKDDKQKPKLEKKKDSRKSSFTSNSERALSDSEEEDTNRKKETTQITLSEIEKIHLQRNFFEKYIDIPNFDINVKDCFVKINMSSNKGHNVSSGYLLGQIKEVVELKDKSYIFNGKPCIKYLHIVHANQEKALSISISSNNPLQESEFNVWRNRMIKHTLPFPTTDDIKNCILNINKIKNYQFSNEERINIVNQKKDQKN